MKKLINAPDAVLQDALHGVEAAHGDRVRVIYDPPVVVRIDAPVQGKVGLVSGGGSGHEPMHGGFVGPGMLDAACPGEVFTSPTPDQMLEATKAVERRRRRRPHRQELHRRRDEFRHGRRDGQGRGHRGRDRAHQRRRGGGGLALHGGPARRRRDRAGREDLRRRGRGRTVTQGGRRAGPPGQRQRPLDGHGAHAVHHARRRATRASSSPRTRWRSASASTASPGASARRSVRPRRSPSG